MDLNISSIQSFHVMAEISLDFLQSAICSLQSANVRHWYDDGHSALQPSTTLNYSYSVEFTL